VAYALERVGGIRQRFDIQGRWPQLEGRYNVRPAQVIPVVLKRSPNSAGLTERGLLPSWANDPSKARRPINARADPLADRPMFREPFRHQRCLVPADGFYEWKAKGKGKVPYLIRLKDWSLYGFGGLYDARRRPDGSELHTCTITTTEPNEVVAPIHERMPAIIKPEDEELWLDSDAIEPERLLPLLRPYPAEDVATYPISRAVNNPRVDTPELIRRGVSRHSGGLPPLADAL
jgi:putative SOS response-associated peptidase YedK